MSKGMSRGIEANISVVSIAIIGFIFLCSKAQALHESLWIQGEPMFDARTQHSATFMADARVLLAGGQGINGILSAAEIYDPVTGLWSRTGSLLQSRKGHGATLLWSERVLLTGGWGDSGALGTVEQYDPFARIWSPAPPLPGGARRALHTAVRISKGRVFVAGGWDESSQARAEAFLFDPSVGSWSVVAPMSLARAGHSATVLANGRVLLTGGWTEAASNALASAELYDPSSGAWSWTGPMMTGRAQHATVLLNDGRIFVAGGLTDNLGTRTNSAEIYDPNLAAWTPLAPMTIERGGHSATAISFGRILIAGGYDSPTSEIYDSTNGIWWPQNTMAIARGGHTATLLHTAETLIAGGQDSLGQIQSSVQIFHPSSLPPAPQLTDAQPSSIVAGNGNFNLDVYGETFLDYYRIHWNDAMRPTVFISSAHLRATIGSQDITSPGTARVTVYNPRLSTQSNAFRFVIAEQSVDLNAIRIFPNPLRPALGHTAVTFSNLPAASRLRIYTLAGELIRDFISDTSGLVTWDGKNAFGEKTASGVYFVFVESGNKTKILKAAIQR